jgi:hypothetical protein
MGRQKVDQSRLFYLFNLEGRIPAHHLLRRIARLARREARRSSVAAPRSNLLHTSPC